ncbi:hypothetical protein TNCV_2041361 [Trichonephila clavipes]|nr:hypothetical protein TNCV_2041361 [Trichonephila clavipes]
MKEGRFILGTFRSKRMLVLYRSRQDDRLRVMLVLVHIDITPPQESRILRERSTCVIGLKISFISPLNSRRIHRVMNSLKIVVKVTKIVKLVTNLVAKNDAHLVLSPRFRQIPIEGRRCLCEYYV